MAHKKQVTALVKGGLGNQLFIYAAARAFSLKNKAKLFLDIETGFASDQYHRKFRLHFFDIKCEICPPLSFLGRKLRRRQLQVQRAFNKLLPESQRNYIAQDWTRDHQQLTRLNTQAKSVLLVGYWQDEEYFTSIEKKLRTELQVPSPSDPKHIQLGKTMKSCNSVFVHFRRKNFPFLIDYEYYQQAINMCITKITNPKFYLFGDEVKEGAQAINFKDTPMEIVSHADNSELDDLWLMTCCRHGIIANSSFSWWAAWLADCNSQQFFWAPLNMGWPMNPSKSWHTISNKVVKV